MLRLLASAGLVLAVLWVNPAPADACGVKLPVKAQRIRRAQASSGDRTPIATGPQDGTTGEKVGAGTGDSGAPIRQGGSDTGGTAPKKSRRPAVAATPPSEPTPTKSPTDIGDRRDESDTSTPEPSQPDPGRGDTDKPDRTERPARFTGKVFFPNGSTSLSASYKAKLRANAKWLQQNSDKTVTVEGHANTVGNADANQELSEGRARAVKDYLVEQGVDESRITVEGFGSTRPEYEPGSSGKNRRVVIRVN